MAWRQRGWRWGFPLLGQKLRHGSALIRPVSAASLCPGFPHLSAYLRVSARPSGAAPGQLSSHTYGQSFLCVFKADPSFCCLKTRAAGGEAARVTAAAHGDGGEACGEMRGRVNPRAAAFPLWICARLNFSRGGWRGAIGHSVNVSGSERPRPRQPPHRRLPLTLSPSGPLFIFLLSSLLSSISCPLPHFYYCLLPRPRHRLQEYSTSCNRQGWVLLLCLFLSLSRNLRWAPIHLSSSSSVSRYSGLFIVGFLLAGFISPECINLLAYRYFTVLIIRFFFLLLSKALLFYFIPRNHLQFPRELSRESS